MITQENARAFQAMADYYEPQRPSVGKWVRITRGRTHKGKEGKVAWHGHDQFACTRYKTEPQLHAMDMRGRDGFRVRVVTLSGESFFVPADYVEVVMPTVDMGPTEGGR